VAVVGKNIWEPGPSSFGRQQVQRLSEITIEPIRIWGDWAKFGGGAVTPWPQHRIVTVYFANKQHIETTEYISKLFTYFNHTFLLKISYVIYILFINLRVMYCVLATL